MSKRGPKRLVTQAVRLGEYGKTKWHIELECGHSVESPRKPKINEERLCCKTCGAPPPPLTLMQALSEDREERDFFEPYDPMGELKTKATIAAKVGVPLDQVDIVNGTATIFLDAQQVKRLKST
tara:strand:- start:4255 stop:4626 length:372 start_codon:yes stop_codon:yes gene_type:complete